MRNELLHRRHGDSAEKGAPAGVRDGRRDSDGHVGHRRGPDHEQMSDGSETMSDGSKNE
jgi:hypothetical protein